MGRSAFLEPLSFNSAVHRVPIRCFICSDIYVVVSIVYILTVTLFLLFVFVLLHVAALNLGKMCEVGRAGPKIGGSDEHTQNESALKYLRLAADGGHPNAQTRLGLCYATGKYGLEGE